jgi:uncharacterized membrane protein
MDVSHTVNWPYVHLLINHFPIILTVVGTATLALAIVTNRRGVWLYALASLTLAGLAIYPVYFTGDQASDALRKTWYIVRSMVREHDESAGWALGAVLPMGAAAAYAWWRMLRREVTGLPPRWLRIVVAVLAVLGLAIVIRTAYLGGKIVHESPKLETPPAGAVPTVGTIPRTAGQTSTMVVGPPAMGVARVDSSL